MKSLKSRYTDKRNMCVIDFYRLVDTIDINQIRFTDFSIDLSIDYSGNIRICMGKKHCNRFSLHKTDKTVFNRPVDHTGER